MGLYVLEAGATDPQTPHTKAGASAFIIWGFDPLQDTIEWGKELIPLVRDGAAAHSR